MAYQSGDGTWNICDESFFCKEREVHPADLLNRRHDAAPSNGPFKCSSWVGTEQERRANGSIGEVKCLNPRTGKTLTFGKVLAPGEIDVPEAFVPLTGGDILAGAPVQILATDSRMIRKVSLDYVVGSNGRYAAAVQRMGKGLSAGLSAPWYAGDIGSDPQRWTPIGRGKSAFSDSSVSLIGITSPGQPVTLGTTLGDKLSRGEMDLEIRTLPGADPKALPEGVARAKLLRFYPLWAGAGRSGFVMRRPLGPFIDTSDILWLLGSQDPPPRDGAFMPPRRSRMAVGIEVATGKVTTRFLIPDPSTTAETPSEGKTTRREYGPYLTAFRKIAGTDRFLLQWGEVLQTVSTEGKTMVTYECRKFCADVIEWYPMKPDEWYAEKKDGLYLVKFPPGTIVGASDKADH